MLNEATKINAKAFLYALRALLCAQWVFDKRSVPPVEFDRLVSQYIASDIIKNKVAHFLNVKSTLSENDSGEVSHALWAFANDLFVLLEKEKISSKGLKTIHSYDEALLKILSAN